MRLFLYLAIIGFIECCVPFIRTHIICMCNDQIVNKCIWSWKDKCDYNNCLEDCFKTITSLYANMSVAIAECNHVTNVPIGYAFIHKPS